MLRLEQRADIPVGSAHRRAAPVYALSSWSPDCSLTPSYDLPTWMCALPRSSPLLAHSANRCALRQTSLSAGWPQAMASAACQRRRSHEPFPVALIPVLGFFHSARIGNGDCPVPWDLA